MHSWVPVVREPALYRTQSQVLECSWGVCAASYQCHANRNRVRAFSQSGCQRNTSHWRLLREHSPTRRSSQIVCRNLCGVSPISKATTIPELTHCCHLWFDREVTNLDYAALLGTFVDLQQGHLTEKGSGYVGLVVSASGNCSHWAGPDPRDCSA
jgi:hypothetical protein